MKVKTYEKLSDLIKEEKKKLKKKEEALEKISEQECELCGELISKKGYSSQPGLCKECEDNLIKGVILKKDDDRE